MRWPIILLLACSFVPGVSLHAQSQDEKDKPKEKPPQQQEPRKPDEPKKPEQSRDERGKPPQRQEQQERDKPPQRQEQQERERQDRERQQHDKNRGQQEQRQQDQRQSRNAEAERQAGHGGRRIPDDRFRASFGHQHTFHVHAQGGGRVQGSQGQRFQYGGYWFEYVEPWPVGWSYDDDCYIDYVDDDYYLFDAFHPGYRLLIIVVE